MALFFHSIASIVLAECACASLSFTSFTDVPSLVCVESKYLVATCVKFLVSFTYGHEVAGSNLTRIQIGKPNHLRATKVKQ